MSYLCPTGNEFSLQSHFLSLCYQAPLLGVLFVSIPTQIIADLPCTFWSRFVFVLSSHDNICYLKEGMRKTTDCCLLM